MAIDATKVTLTQISGGLSNPAPAFYSIYYNGAGNDWKVDADVGIWAAKAGVQVGDGFIIRFETAPTGAITAFHITGYFGGSAAAMSVNVNTTTELA